MSLQPVQWILVVKYNKTAHRALYGRMGGEAKYSKDYIQLPRRQDFIADLGVAFPSLGSGAASTPITYSWPTGYTVGTLFSESADRPHLAWGTNKPPAPWRMSPAPNLSTEETIPGDPTFSTAIQADGEFARLASQGFGQPYLIAVKLFGASSVLHICVSIDNPTVMVQWADLANAPVLVQDLARSTTQNSAVKWRLFSSPQDPAIIYFDPAVKGNPWGHGNPATPGVVQATVVPPFVGVPVGGNSGASFPSPPVSPSGAGLSSGSGQQSGTASAGGSSGTAAQSSPKTVGSGGPSANVSKVKTAPQPIDRDAWAEGLEGSEEEVKEFEDAIEAGNYVVPDSEGWVKTRGSAQRAFAKKVKDNYGWRCALTGICSREFLIASHIVPWSEDQSIRLDPENGICLSVMVDKAFEHGFVVIEDDYTVHIVPQALTSDPDLEAQLAPYDGASLKMPSKHRPNPDYLRRRRSL